MAMSSDRNIPLLASISPVRQGIVLLLFPYISWLLLLLLAVQTRTVQARPAKVVDGAFIVELSPFSQLGKTREIGAVYQHDLFHKRAVGLDYQVRHEFTGPYLGLSLNLVGVESVEDGVAKLSAIPGVLSASPVWEVSLLDFPPTDTPTTHAFTSYEDPEGVEAFPSGTSNLATALQMGDVDKVHELGIKGKGIKIGIIDTGVDFRHPALGEGFGPGHKIAGGYSWVTDNGTLHNDSSPLATCYGGGHGTHVAGIVGMDPLKTPKGLAIAGVAPEASIYMYRVFDCTGHGHGSDYILKAMMKAGFEDGVDVISMSLAIGSPPITGVGDPLAAVVKELDEAGVAVVVAVANDASPSKTWSQMYTAEWPSTEPRAIGVGAVANINFPLVFPAADSSGANMWYASIWPVGESELDVFMVDDGCSTSNWDEAVKTVDASGKLNSTAFAFQVTDMCRSSDATVCCQQQTPIYVLGYHSDMRNPYNIPFSLPPQGRFGTTHFMVINATDGATFTTSWAASGGYGKYKIRFPRNSSYSSVSQSTGGMMDYYSSFGPVRLTYDLKPQLSAPGGNVLSTYPLGRLGGYAILSGTSMATPYVAGCYALVKTQFPGATTADIKTILQTTANPLSWFYNTSMLAATQQQGAGLINVYRAITSRSRVSPGQLLISDVSRTEYGKANVTITNNSPISLSYTLSSQGAGYMDQLLERKELNQKPKYGTVTFATDNVHLPPGQSATVSLSVAPPSEVVPGKLPVFGGFININASSGETFVVPYVGPPYSLYHTDSIHLYESSTLSLPEIRYTYLNGTQVAIQDILVVNNSMAYGSSATYDLWTTAYRVDVLPANTSLVPTHYGFNSSRQIPYLPSKTSPKTSFLGYPSYGNLKNTTGLLSPGNNLSPSAKGGLTVRGENGDPFELAPGDYRWALGILRWTGDATVLEDWETWLGPVIRLVDGNV